MFVSGGPLGLDVSGPGAAALGADIGENLIMRAAEAALRACPQLVLGTFRLEKHLPTAAGLGGGSADAAAALRLIRRANPDVAGSIDWMGLALSIGADVPVCMASRASLMAGLGDRLTLVAGLPALWAVLANPGVALSTRDVFMALAAGPVGAVCQAPVPDCTSPAALVAALIDQPNDLEATAKSLCPPIADVLAALACLDGALLTRMSGSGPTCFALFADADEADAACRSLRSVAPSWWIEAAPLC